MVPKPHVVCPSLDATASTDFAVGWSFAAGLKISGLLKMHWTKPGTPASVLIMTGMLIYHIGGQVFPSHLLSGGPWLLSTDS